MLKDTKPNKLRILLIGHRYHMVTRAKGFYDALGRAFDLNVHFVEDMLPTRFVDIAADRHFDACIWFVQFKDLIDKDAFDWCGFEGARLLYDWDVFQNYHNISETRYHGRWPLVFRRDRFHMVLCTGRKTRDRLRSDGVPAQWVPKAYDPLRLYDLHKERKGLCYFGAVYPARRRMLRYLSRRQIAYSVFRCRDSDLNIHLNRYLGCIICNMSVYFRIRSRHLLQFLPEIACTLGPGTEPMLKNFEAPGAGCTPITDDLPEFDALGFHDGETMVAYKTFHELYEKLLYYQGNPDKLRAIGEAANALVMARHTWDHRARQIQAILGNGFEITL